MLLIKSQPVILENIWTSTRSLYPNLILALLTWEFLSSYFSIYRSPLPSEKSFSLSLPVCFLLSRLSCVQKLFMCQSSELDAGSDLTENVSFASPPSFHFYLCRSLAVHCVSTPNHLCWYKDGRNENRSMFLVVVKNAFSNICASLCLLKVLIEQPSWLFSKFHLKFN